MQITNVNFALGGMNVQLLTPPPTVPGAPTIGTATATGATTATVSFTAPDNNGGAIITSYTATSSPAGGTGTLSQAGSGTINVTGLTAGTSYTFTVTATNSAGTGASSSSSNSITTVENPPTVIGQSYGGGYYAGQISTTGNGTATHYLVLAPKATGEYVGKQWKTTNDSTTGTSSDIDGPTNSSNMNNASHPAAQFCEGLTIGGYTDWYMPAKNELEVCYYNLKPSGGANNITNSGINPNAVPARSSNYTQSVPAVTSVALFATGSEKFGVDSSSVVWSSTESGGAGWCQVFQQGWQLAEDKDKSYTVRAVRRVPV